MDRKILMGLGVSIALIATGCSKEEKKPEQKNGASGAVSTGPVKREAGSWKSEITINKLEGEGIPPGTKEMMAGMFSSMAAIEVCLTPELAAKEESAEDLMKGQNAQDCTFNKKEVTGSMIDLDAVCKKGAETATIKMTGTREPRKTDAVMNVTGKAPTGAGQMNMEMHIVSTRTGDCKPGQMTADGKKT